MNTPLALKPVTIATTVITTAILTFGLLWFAAIPRPAAQRLVAIEAQMRSTAAIAGKANRPLASRGWALCGKPADVQAPELGVALAGLARAQGVALSLSTAKVSADGEADRIDIEFLATGSYEELTSLLEEAGHLQPTLFAASIDIAAKGATSELLFKGSTWCAKA